MDLNRDMFVRITAPSANDLNETLQSSSHSFLPVPCPCFLGKPISWCNHSPFFPLLISSIRITLLCFTTLWRTHCETGYGGMRVQMEQKGASACHVFGNTSFSSQLAKGRQKGLKGPQQVCLYLSSHSGAETPPP